MVHLAIVAPFNFTFDTLRFLRAYSAAGCISAQFYRDAEKPIDLGEARNLIEVAGSLKCDSIHGLFGPMIDPSSPDREKRLSAVSTYQREGDVALTLGGPAVVVHPSWMWSDGKAMRLSNKELQAREAALRRSMEDLARIGEGQGVTYLVENLPSTFTFGSSAMQIAQWVRFVGSRNLRMCFDTGHAHIESVREGAMADQLESCIDVVDYLHVHDNDGIRDSHLMPGDGNIDWKSFAAVLSDARPRKDWPCMLEVFYPETQVESLVAQQGLKERLARLIGA